MTPYATFYVLAIAVAAAVMHPNEILSGSGFDPQARRPPSLRRPDDRGLTTGIPQHPIFATS